MIYKNFKGFSVPAVGLGTWKMQGQECKSAVLEALSCGYRHIDTAQRYNNEEFVGEAISQSGVARDDIVITTKLWLTNLKRKDVFASVEESLNKLQTGYIDLLLIHWPSTEVNVKETLNAMLELKEKGKVKHIGVSNFTVELMKEALNVTPDIVTNQVEFHPYLYQKKLMEFCAENGVGITAYSPLASGNILSDPTLREIAGRLGKSVAQITLKWLVELPKVIVIPKSGSRKHIEQNVDIFDFALESEDVERISGLDRKERFINPDFAPEW